MKFAELLTLLAVSIGVLAVGYVVVGVIWPMLTDWLTQLEASLRNVGPY